MTRILRVEVRNACDHSSAANKHIEIARQLDMAGLVGCQEIRLYFFSGTLSVRETQRLAELLLADPVTETWEVTETDQAGAAPAWSSYIQSAAPDHVIEVAPLPGVTDPPAESVLRAAQVLGIAGVERAATGASYLLWGDLTPEVLRRLAVEVFSNPLVQSHAIDHPISAPFAPYQPIDDTVEIIPIRHLDDDGLLRVSRERRLALDVDEMRAIRDYFDDEERDPTDAELEMLAQTWSEHCVHKTFKALIDFRMQEGSAPSAAVESSLTAPTPHVVNGLLRTYIRAATEEINKPWVRSAFVDNAGIVAFNDHFDLAFKVETHNHPSALEPFGGANTGVGGVVRDILGVSARPIANTDVLCFGLQDLPHTDLPAGVLHPRRIADGVVHGIEDYGNKMGIPTVNGAILYHPGYTANPLVFCGCLGILPRGAHPSNPQPGDYIVVLGGRTGRDGLRGATFSSMEMDQATGRVAGSAVQIGHPIHEKQVLEVILRARDAHLYNAITDCGAGGLSSAVGEMAKEVGAHVQLDTVPLKYPGLRPWEIWLSEAQERMVLAVPPHHWPMLKAICDAQDIEAVQIGQLESTGRLKLFYGSKLVADLSMDFLHNGILRRRLTAVYEPALTIGDRAQAGPGSLSAHPSPETLNRPFSMAEVLLSLLAHPNIRSKEHVVRRYDHEVQGGGAVKPLVGVDNHGPSDAAVLVPAGSSQNTQHGAQSTESRIQNSESTLRGVALSAGICPQYGELDPYAMAWAAVDEAMRNAVAVGADPDRIALLDNFCWGNPNLPDRLGSLVRCAQGCYDAAIAYQAPFISGKDSLNNEYTGADGRKHAIPGTLLISALGIVPDVNRTCTVDLKQAGNVLYVVGDTRPEFGGAAIWDLRLPTSEFGAPARSQIVPAPVSDALDRLRALHRAISAGLVQACHDCSEGGIAVALAEMCLAGRLGAQVDLSRVPLTERSDDPAFNDQVALYAESLTRFIVEVRPEDVAPFEALMAGVPHAAIGAVSAGDELVIHGQSSELIRVPVAGLERSWRGGGESGRAGEGESTTAGEHESGRAADRKSTRVRERESGRVGRRPRVLILHATGTNRDHDAALACEMAGGEPEIVHVNQLISGERELMDYHMLVVPGGFSYGDDLGAGVLWALDLRHRLGDAVARFVADGRPVLGICNGFQALVKAGVLPGDGEWESGRSVTLTFNASGHFECRWVYLKANSASPCVFTRGMDELIYCPVAHGEGRLAVRDDDTLQRLERAGLIALTYTDAAGGPVGYPGNPNGSVANIAGLCNPAGNVLGLMPHPENHVFPWQHPRRHRGEAGLSGLKLFMNGIRAA
ncbi:MAG: phosphoribosylformylglycinamidine synthase I [Anaerolineae bacterium]|nr:phosphoribosylformylglycinamidine synthase I [Thermoflexales bacterium]MDW8408633.1 phosphoribosylformylglycinamidine synthase I [Anaerolineae bacterium]